MNLWYTVNSFCNAIRWMLSCSTVLGLVKLNFFFVRIVLKKNSCVVIFYFLFYSGWWSFSLNIIIVIVISDVMQRTRRK